MYDLIKEILIFDFVVSIITAYIIKSKENALGLAIMVTLCEMAFYYFTNETMFSRLDFYNYEDIQNIKEYIILAIAVIIYDIYVDDKDELLFSNYLIYLIIILAIFKLKLSAWFFFVSLAVDSMLDSFKCSSRCSKD